MSKEKRPQVESADLRRLAEELLIGNTVAILPPRTDEEMLRSHHELQVHQLELEMQNAQLNEARDDAETALEKYTDLYDFAPVSYFTLDRKGTIHNVNLTGAAILGFERSRLIGRRFEHFIPQDARSFIAVFLGKVFASQGKEACEVALLKEGNSPPFVRIEAMAAASEQECRVALIDITERKRMEEALGESVVNQCNGALWF